MTSSARPWLALAALNGLMAVCAGAFGAHGVRDPLVGAWLSTGAEYQLAHAVAGLTCFMLIKSMALQARIAGWLFGLGALVFGGSLYALALSGVGLLGVLTPVGGLLMIVGWAVLLWGAVAGTRAE